MVPELDRNSAMRLPRILSVISFRHSKGASLFSSLSIEDQTLTDIIVKMDKSARIFTLDRQLFPETYQLIDKTNMTYGINVEVFFPNYEAVQQMVKEEGINLFYHSIEPTRSAGKKLEPLKRAMQDSTYGSAVESSRA